MKTSIVAVLAWTALTGVAAAQSVSKGYVEGVAQSTFGNVTSQGYGVEAGVSLGINVQVFGEVMRVKDTAPASLLTSAQLIANGLSQTQTNVGYHAEQPAVFGAAGFRFVFPTTSSEFERTLACGSSVWTTTLGARGSLTSTPVKFFGADSCASHRMRRPSRASWIAMPSPMPPNPDRS